MNCFAIWLLEVKEWFDVTNNVFLAYNYNLFYLLIVRWSPGYLFLFFSVVSHQGPNQRRLYSDLMNGYNPLVRPVQNDSQSLIVSFGLTLMQIMDVVRKWIPIKHSCLYILHSTLLHILYMPVKWYVMHGYVSNFHIFKDDRPDPHHWSHYSKNSKLPSLVHTDAAVLILPQSTNIVFSSVSEAL